MFAIKNEVTYKKLIKFFLPLAVMPFIVGLSHNIVNASLARLSYPEITLGVFAIIKSLVNIIKSPIHMTRQTVTSLVDDEYSFKFVSSFILFLSLLYFLVIGSFGYTKLGSFVFEYILGLKNSQEITFATQAVKIMAFIPIVESLRNVFQGIAISLKRTNLITPGVVIRVISISVLLFWLTINEIGNGIKAASAVWVIGMSIELLFILLALYYYYGNFTKVIDSLPNTITKKINLKVVIKFFIPIGIMAFLTSFVQPIIQSGIVRNSITTNDLAAYGVSWTLVMIFVGPLNMLHQCSLVYASELNKRSWKRILKFSLGMGFSVSLILVILTFTKVGDFILINLISVSPQITRLVKKIIFAFVLLPFIRSFREIFWGIMMQQQTTNIIAVGKIAGLFFIVFIFSLLVLITDINVGVIAALALTAGEVADALTISIYIMRKNILNKIYMNNY